jgi:hypothetical protein
MELKVTHLSAVIPQLSVMCTGKTCSIDVTNNCISAFGDDVAVYLEFFADQFPLTEDTSCQIVEAKIVDVDRNQYHIRHSAQPSISINGNEVTLTYTDCLLPLNGTNGTIIVKFINQL